MVLDLKRILVVDGAEQRFNYGIDMSSFESDSHEFPIKDPVKVEGLVRNIAGVVELTAKATLCYQTICDRCCVPVSEKITQPISYLLATSVQNEDSEEILLVENEQLDLDQLVISDIILNLPMKHLCDENCKGLCPVCGKNLNEGNCDCDRQKIDPRLKTLQDFFD